MFLHPFANFEVQGVPRVGVGVGGELNGDLGMM